MFGLQAGFIYAIFKGHIFEDDCRWLFMSIIPFNVHIYAIPFVFSAPGGTLSDDLTRTEFCLFTAQEDLETMQAYAQVNMPNDFTLTHLRLTGVM